MWANPTVQNLGCLRQGFFTHWEPCFPRTFIELSQEVCASSCKFGGLEEASQGWYKCGKWNHLPLPEGHEAPHLLPGPFFHTEQKAQNVWRRTASSGTLRAQVSNHHCMGREVETKLFSWGKSRIGFCPEFYINSLRGLSAHRRTMTSTQDLLQA